MLAIVSKFVWDNYRYSPTMTDPNRAIVLVIGQQFKWNVIYPGPDKKIGRYLLYPQAHRSAPGRTPPATTSHILSPACAGPAFLPYDNALTAIDQYIDTVNPLGKDFTDPDGKDDDWQGAWPVSWSFPRTARSKLSSPARMSSTTFSCPTFA